MRNYNSFCRFLTHFLLKHILHGFMILLVMRNSGSRGIPSNSSVPESSPDTLRISVNPLSSVIDQKPVIFINESKDNSETELYRHMTNDLEDLEKAELEVTPHITDDTTSFPGKSTIRLTEVFSETVPLSTKNILDNYSSTADVEVSAGMTETAKPLVVNFTEPTNLTGVSSTDSSHLTNLRHNSTALKSVDMHLESSGEEIRTAPTATEAETSSYPSDGNNAETLELYYSSTNDSGDPVVETSTIRLSESQTHDFVPNYSGSNFVSDVQSVFSVGGSSIVTVNTAAVRFVNVSDSGVPKERTGSRALLDVTDACPSGHRKDSEGRCRALFGPATRPAQGAPTSHLEDLEHNSFWSLHDIIKWFIYQYG